MSLQSIALKDAPGWLYPFTDTSGTALTDASGNGNDGTLVGSPTLNQRSLIWGPWEGRSTLFDGSSQRVTVPGSVVTTTTYTYVFLIRPETVSGVQCIAHDGTNGIYINSGKLSFYYSSTYHDADTTLVAGTKYLLEVVVTAGAVAFYVDRVPDGTASSAPAFSATSLFAESGGGNELHVTAGFAACYPGTALAASRIREKYRQAFAVGMRKVVTNLNPYGLWPMGERSGAVGYDVSGNDNDGVYSGVTLGQTHQVHQQTGTSVLFDGSAGHLVISDATEIQNVFDGGGCAGVVLNATSDGEADAGRVMDKGSWSIAITSESGGAAKITFTQQFSTTDGVWETTATDLTLGGDDTLMVDYDADSVSNDPVIYVSGQSVALTESSTPVGARTTDVGSDLYIGNNAAGSATFHGRQSWAFLAPSIAAYQALQFNECRRSRFAAEVISFDPTGYWRGNEPSGTTLIDYGSEGNDGTLNNATFGNAESPLSNEAATSINFDGSGDYVSIPHVAAYNQSEQTWVFNSYAPATQPSPDIKGVIWKAANTAIIAEINASYRPTGGDGLRVSVDTAAGNPIDIADDSVFGSGWNFGALTKALNGANDDLAGYLDGALIDTITTTGHGDQNSDALEFGRASTASTAGRYYQGQIAEVAVFPAALTASQILDIYEMASYELISDIIGTLTESLDATDWTVRAHDLADGSLVGEASVVSGVYALYLSAATSDVLVTMQADIGAVFVDGATYAVDDYLYPTVVDDTTHFYKCTGGGVAASEPGTWNTAGGTSTSGACTFQDMGVIPEFKTQLAQPEEG